MPKPHMIITALILAAIALTGAVAHSGPFPLNGDFERSYRGTPFGWDESGAWAPRPINSYEGRSHFMLNHNYARAGDELLSRSFRLISEGQTLALSLAYQSSGPGASVSLVFCDALGRPLGERWKEPLTPSESWRVFETQYEVGASPEPEGTASVRVAITAACENLEVHVDAVDLRVTGERPDAPAMTAMPEMDPWSGGGVLRAVSAEVIAPCIVGGDYDGEGDPERLALWLSSPVTVAGTYPYEAQADALLSGAPDAEGFILLRALGEDPAEVLWQEMQPIPPGDAFNEVSVTLPAPYIHEHAMQLQSGLAVSSLEPAVAELTGLRAHLLPLTVSINGVMRSTTFNSPEDVQIFVSAVNSTSTALATEARVSVVDEEGRVVHREQRTINMRPRSAASFPVRPSVPENGRFTFHVSFLRGSSSAASGEFDFSVGAPDGVAS